MPLPLLQVHVYVAPFSTSLEIIALFVWACLTDKSWLKVLLADLV